MSDEKENENPQWETRQEVDVFSLIKKRLQRVREALLAECDLLKTLSDEDEDV